MPTELVLVRGLPGSGKSTIARYLAENHGYTHCEADQYFERGGSYRFDPAKIKDAHSDCLAMATEAIKAGRSCVASNTFTQRWEWQPYVDAARKAGVPVRFIEARGHWPSVHGVPESIIDKMRARWEPLPSEFRPG